MAKRKIFLLLLMCGTIFFTACGEEEEPPEPEIPRLVYVALGDSVSEGVGIWSAADRHSAVFFEMLQAYGYANEYVNLAVAGHTSSDLLRLLNGLGPDALETMQYASVITVNIGGNNIIEPFAAYMPNAAEIQRITDETLTFVREAREIVDELMEFANESHDTIEDVLNFANEVVYFAENFGILDVFRLREMAESATPVIDGAMEVFDEFTAIEAAATEMFDRATGLEALELFALLSGEFPDELEVDFQASVRQFSYDFPEILAWLENNAPNAEVIVNTVYNPIPAYFMGMEIAISHESRRLIREINYIILEESNARGLIVSDVYADLSQNLDLMLFSFDLIHPNHHGHDVIARLNFSDFLQRQ